MITEQQLKDIFDDEIKGPLAATHKIRKAMYKHLYIAGILCVAAITFLFAPPKWIRITGFWTLILLAVYQIALAQYQYKKLVPYYKKHVVANIINLIDATFEYDANKHIDVETFNNSAIFKTEAFVCDGDDRVTGKIDKTTFQFSELHARDVSTSKQGSWPGATIFHGLFIKADFNKHIMGSTFVMPNKEKEVTNIVGNEKRELKHFGELVKLENPEFEQIFSVYSSSQQEARYIITPAIMEAMVTIYKMYNRNMYFSFINDHAHCAVSFSKNGVMKGLFEPPAKKGNTSFGDIKEVYHLFMLIQTIINELNLNTRIWTKQ